MPAQTEVFGIEIGIVELLDCARAEFPLSG